MLTIFDLLSESNTDDKKSNDGKAEIASKVGGGLAALILARLGYRAGRAVYHNYKHVQLDNERQYGDQNNWDHQDVNEFNRRVAEHNKYWHS